MEDLMLYGKIAKFPKNTDGKKAIDFFEKIKMPRNKIWYIMIEKQNEELQMIKYNNKGVNLNVFLNELKNYYVNNKEILQYINNFEIEGNDKFTSIKNIPDVNINNTKLITIIMQDLIKLLV